MNANGKKTGFRVAALFVVAGASMAVAAGSSSSGEAVAYDQVVLVSKDAPSQQSGHDGGGERSLFDDSFIGGGIIGGEFIGGNILGNDFFGGGVVNGSIAGDGGVVGNTNGNSLGNQTGD